MTLTTNDPARLPNAMARLRARLDEGGASALARHLRIAGLQRLHTAAESVRARLGRPDPTLGKHELDTLTVREGDVAAGVHFLSTPWAVLDLVHRALPADKAAFTFVDLGAGKGRAVLSAARLPYRRIVGVEFAIELATVAEANVRSAGHDAARVTIVEGDAAAFTLPHGPLVVFLFNPFGPPVFDRVVDRIACAGCRGHETLVAYLNPAHEGVLADHPDFERRPLPWHLSARLGLLSPYRLAIFGVRSSSAS